MPVRATRLPQHQNPKNMLETVARWSIRSTKGWPTPLQRVITQPRPTADRGWLCKIMARPSCVPVSILRVFPDIGAAPPRARTTHAEVSPKTGTPKATASRNRNCSAPQPRVRFGLNGFWARSLNRGNLQLAGTSAFAQSLSRRCDIRTARDFRSTVETPRRFARQDCVQPFEHLRASDPARARFGAAAQSRHRRGDLGPRSSGPTRYNAQAFSMPPGRSRPASMPSSASTWRSRKRCLAHRRCSTTISMRSRPRRAARSRAGGDTWVLVSDADGQQLLNTFAQPGQALPRRNPIAIAAQRPRILNTFDSDNRPLERSAHAGFGLPISRFPSSRTASPFAGSLSS